MIRIAGLYAVFCFFLFPFTPAYSQELPMLHYTIADGAPSNTIYDIYRDSKGFLWFASNKGIAKYNGIKFERYTTFDGLPDNEIFFFQEDYEDRLWMATYNGELCFYKNGTIHTAENTPYLKLPFHTPFIKAIRLEEDSSITIQFLGARKFVNFYHDKCRIYYLEKLNDITDYNFIRFIKKIPGKGFELVLENEVMTIDENCKEISSKKDCFPKHYVYSFCQNQKNFCTADTIFNEAMEPLYFLKNKAFIYKIFHFETNTLVATEKGLLINNNFHILTQHKVSALNSDIEGNYWVGTLNDGIYCFSKNFTGIREYPDAYKGVVAYAGTNNRDVYYTTNNNAFYRLANGRSQCIIKDNVHNKEYHSGADPACYINGHTYYNNFENHHYVIRNIQTENPIVEKYDADKYTEYARNIIVIDSAGDQAYLHLRDTLIGASYLWSKTNGRIIRKGIDNEGPRQRIYGFAKINNAVWYSTVSSMTKIVDGKAVAQPQFNNHSLKNFIQWGAYMIGYTHHNELIVCEDYERNIKFDTVKNQDCIWNNFYAIDSSHILISTDNLYRLLILHHAQNGTSFSITTIQDPFLPLQADNIVVAADTCYFFKKGTISCFPVFDLYQKATPPILLFTFFKAGKKQYSIDSVISIPYNDAKNISISFSALAFSSKIIQYEYSISKDDIDNWRVADANELNLFIHGFGDYAIRLRAKSLPDNFTAPITLRFNVARPYWATWWFILLSLLAVFALVRYALRYRIQQVLRKKEKEHVSDIKYLKSEYKALNALMNPHFIFNTLNNVQGLINGDDKLAANNYLRIFSDLVRQNMNNIKQETIPLQREVDLLINYLKLEKLRFKDAINYVMTIDEDLDMEEIMIPPLLIQPLVENSIKHGLLVRRVDDNCVRITIRQKEGKLYIEVKDNGVGIDHAQVNDGHQSSGLENIKKRIEQLSIMHNKEISFHISEIKDSKGMPAGTCATIILDITD